MSGSKVDESATRPSDRPRQPTRSARAAGSGCDAKATALAEADPAHPEPREAKSVDLLATLDATDFALNALRTEAQTDATRALQREIVAQRDELLSQLYGGSLRRR